MIATYYCHKYQVFILSERYSYTRRIHKTSTTAIRSYNIVHYKT
jgi:hypothetical protein